MKKSHEEISQQPVDAPGKSKVCGYDRYENLTNKKRTTELYEFRPISLRGAYDAFSFHDQSHISNRGRLIVFNGFKQLQRREIKFPAVSLVNRNLMAIRRIYTELFIARRYEIGRDRVRNRYKERERERESEAADRVLHVISFESQLDLVI